MNKKIVKTTKMQVSGVVSIAVSKKLCKHNRFSSFPKFQYVLAKLKNYFTKYRTQPLCDFIGLICFDWRTTLMIRSIPNKYSVCQLAAQIDSQHADTYDFLYLPCDLKVNILQIRINVMLDMVLSILSVQNIQNLFTQNLISTFRKSTEAKKFVHQLTQGFKDQNQLIQHFSNSKVLYQKQKKYRPIIKMDQIHKWFSSNKKVQ